ncbi:aldehyde dehydrogenase [Paraburkholderia panacisoli]|uniref:Aldehyde dehydrogenase n=1 Tax=Paraburkholderia panacisoli TaxID=2603818 RepID=A0A5B0FXU8_9BURK|nr:aldehyde dehydrogenase family protein [Paraburkholderia panacisoli]KAA0996083.1 aldehyde dehydrogenase [Paraburkholderia panacisoli]
MKSSTQVAGDALNSSLHPVERIVVTVSANKEKWATTPVGRRVELLKLIREALVENADEWARLASAAKGLPTDSPLVGEEWTSGPWAALTAIDVLLCTLTQLNGLRFLDAMKVRTTATNQTAVQVFPTTLTDRLLLSGVSAEVWMEPGVLPSNLRRFVACAYDPMRQSSVGSVSLVLGAGNITSIAPLDALYKLYAEHSVVVLKLNPVTAYLLPVFEKIFAALIEEGVFAIVNGGTDVGVFLTGHPLVETLHITGSAASHDAIVFGTGEEGVKRKAQDIRVNTRPITSELGAVCPTIVVPGHWTNADIRFQAEHIATQKLHNSGFNCVASQVLILPQDWPHAAALLSELKRVFSSARTRPLYYPGSSDRLAAFREHYPAALSFARGSDAPRLLAILDGTSVHDDYAFRTEVFGPALTVVFLPGAAPEAFLESAIDFANTKLHGTLGANVIIDPATEKTLGSRFEALLTDLRYGTIAVNAWTGLGFLLAQTPWGAFPGHPMNNIQSGRGIVHNCFLFDRPQRSVVRAPFRPFPRALLHGSFTMLPRPPWFISNRTSAATVRKLFAFQARPSLFKLLGIFVSAVRG